MAEYGTLLFGGKGLSDTVKTEEREPISGMPQGRVKRLVPDARGRGH